MSDDCQDEESRSLIESEDIRSTTPADGTHIPLKYGIPHSRIVNSDKILIIEELIKCIICKKILKCPLECSECGALFCEGCVNDWLKYKKTCPNSLCNNFQVVKCGVNTKKMLDLVILRCINYPKCTFESDYISMEDHEKKCEFKKIKCPHQKCDFSDYFDELKDHLLNKCMHIKIYCEFCKSKIEKNNYGAHLDEHYKNKSFYLASCIQCGSSQNLKKCICKKTYCYKCLCLGILSNRDCIKNCYVFQDGNNYISNIYNISKFPLPRNFEVKLLFINVSMVRAGITFDKSIINNQVDENCPDYDIYCILEDLVQFYTKSYGWKNIFNKKTKKNQGQLKNGDIMTITFIDDELRYYINDNYLGVSIKIYVDKKPNSDFYLFVQSRNDKNRVEILNIFEVNN